MLLESAIIVGVCHRIDFFEWFFWEVIDVLTSLFKHLSRKHLEFILVQIAIAVSVILFPEILK